MTIPPKTKKAQTFIVDTDLGPQIQMVLAQSRIAGKAQKYANISDFVNIAIKNQLAKEKK